MASTHEEIQARVDQLEREVRALESSFSRSVRRADGRGGDVTLNRIAFSVWLQITGPTFATIIFGFALLWNGQQVLAEQQLEHTRSIGRLEGSLDGMQRSVQGLERSVARVESSITRFEGSITALDARIDKLGASVDRLSESVGTR